MSTKCLEMDPLNENTCAKCTDQFPEDVFEIEDRSKSNYYYPSGNLCCVWETVNINGSCAMPPLSSSNRIYCV